MDCCPVRLAPPRRGPRGASACPDACNRGAPAWAARLRACQGQAGAARFVDGQIARAPGMGRGHPRPHEGPGPHPKGTSSPPHRRPPSPPDPNLEAPNDPRPQHRHDRLRLHGPLPLQRLPHRPELLRPAAPPGPQGRLRPRRGEDAGLRGPLGLRIDRDRLAQADRAPRHRPRRHLRPQRPPRRDRHRRRRGGQGRHHRKAPRPHRRRRREDGRRRREGRRAQPRLLQLPPHARRQPGQAGGRLGQARPHLPLPREVPAGLDHLARRPPGRRRHLAARRRGRGLRRHRRPPRPLPRQRDLDQRRDHEPDRHDRDLRQGAHPRRDRQDAAGRHRRRRRRPHPLRERLARHLRVRPATPAATRRPTRSRSTASTARSPGTCTT